MTRPEAGDDYGYGLHDHYDRDAWKEFTPWRPGDRSDSERPVESAGSWWTETPARSDQASDSGHRFKEGEQVRSVRNVGGTLGGAVPADTLGKVVSVGHGLFDERVTVEFVNGYPGGSPTRRDQVRERLVLDQTGCCHTAGQVVVHPSTADRPSPS